MDFVRGAIDAMGRKAAEHQASFDLVHASWAVDLEQGQLVFTAPDGREATCSLQIVGTHSTEHGSWMWGWDHPSVREGLDRAALAAKAWGEQHGMALFTTRLVSVGEGECWAFTAVACELTGAAGTYRAPLGATHVYLTYDDVKVRHPNDPRVGDWPPLGGIDGVPDEALAALEGFLNDRYAWEVGAQALSASGADATRVILDGYKALTDRWCHPVVGSTGVAFSSHPAFQPGRYRLKDGGVDDDRCRVQVVDDGLSGDDCLYEARMVRNDERWQLASLAYLDGDDAYESL